MASVSHQQQQQQQQQHHKHGQLSTPGSASWAVRAPATVLLWPFLAIAMQPTVHAMQLHAQQEPGGATPAQQHRPSASWAEQSIADIQRLWPENLTDPLAVNPEHNCQISTAGAVKCFGGNRFGECGLPWSFADFTYLMVGDVPTEMGDGLPAVDLGTSFTAVQVSIGGYHTCALNTNGSVKCFGYNNFGQLGLGISAQGVGTVLGEMGDALPFVDLGEGFKVAQVAAATFHTCAMSTEGAVKCWGRNVDAQLGIGHTRTIGREPGQMGDNLPAVNLGATFRAIGIAAGPRHTCALNVSRELSCWGFHGYGHNYASKASDVSAFRPKSFDDTAAFRGAPMPYWGDWPPSGTTGTVLRPHDDPLWGDEPGELEQYVQIPSGWLTWPEDFWGVNAHEHSPGRNFDNWTSYTLDYKNWTAEEFADYGLQLPSPFYGNPPLPFDVGSPYTPWNFQQVAAGFFHTCALSASGRVRCFGDPGRIVWSIVDRAYGSVRHSAAAGNATRTSGKGNPFWGAKKTEFWIPWNISMTARTLADYANQFPQHVFLNDTVADEYWGEFEYGPIPPYGTNFTVVKIAAGAVHTCALSAGGEVKCHGSNTEGQLGRDGRAPVAGESEYPVAQGWNESDFGDGMPVVDLGIGFVACDINAMGYYTCATSTTGCVKCWGYNLVGVLGLGSQFPAHVGPDGTMGDALPCIELGSDFVVSCDGLKAGFAPGAPESPAPTPSSASPATSFGDPHLANIKGEKFDVLSEGNYVYLAIPRQARTGERPLLRIAARVEAAGPACGAALYVTALTFEGSWLGGSLSTVQFSTALQSSMEANSLKIRVAGAAHGGGAPAAGAPPPAMEEVELHDFAARVPPSLAKLTVHGGQAAPKLRNQHVTVAEVKLWLGPAVVKVFLEYQKEEHGSSNSLSLTATGLQHVMEGSGAQEIGGILGLDSHEEAARPPAACEEAEGILPAAGAKSHPAAAPSARAPKERDGGRLMGRAYAAL